MQIVGSVLIYTASWLWFAVFVIHRAHVNMRTCTLYTEGWAHSHICTATTWLQSKGTLKHSFLKAVCASCSFSPFPLPVFHSLCCSPPHPFICVSQIASLSATYPILTRFSSTKLWGNTRWLCPKPHNARGGPSKSTATLPVKNLILLVLTKRHSMAAAILLEAQLNGVSRSA